MKQDKGDGFMFIYSIKPVTDLTSSRLIQEYSNLLLFGSLWIILGRYCSNPHWLFQGHEAVTQTSPRNAKDWKKCNCKESSSWCSSPAKIQLGRDDISFQRHNRVLQAEWSKVKWNVMVVGELMERTFPMRRREILDNSCNVQTLFKKFPFLQDPEQVIVAHFCAYVRCV